MRRTLSLLIVLMMTLGPFAQGVDVIDDHSISSPDRLGFESPVVSPTSGSSSRSWGTCVGGIAP